MTYLRYGTKIAKFANGKARLLAGTAGGTGATGGTGSTGETGSGPLIYGAQLSLASIYVGAAVGNVVGSLSAMATSALASPTFSMASNSALELVSGNKVAIAAAGLAVGSYSASVTVSASNATTQTFTISVSVIAAPAVPTGTSDTTTDGIARGIYGPTAKQVSPDGGAYACASYFARGIAGVLRWTLTGANASSFSISQGGLLTIGIGIYNSAAGTSFNINVVVDNTLSGGTDSIVLPVVVTFMPTNKPQIYMQNWVCDSLVPATGATVGNDWCNIYTFSNAPQDSGTITPTGAGSSFFAFNTFGDNVAYVLPGILPWSANYGLHNITLNIVDGLGNSSSIVEPIYVVHSKPPAVQVATSTVYDTSAAGSVVAQIVASSDSGLLTYAVNDIRFTVTTTGQVLLAGSLAGKAGSTINFYATVADSATGKTTVVEISPSIGTGTILAPTAMTMTVNPALTNWVNPAMTPLAIGAPTVAGMTGTISWSITQTNNDIVPYSATANTGMLPKYSINASTGAVTALPVLSATGDTLTITATSGATSCTQSFVIPVAACQGPTLYVGKGMSTTYPSTGYETLAECLALFSYNNLLPAQANAGATILVHTNYDSSGNYLVDYYAGDNGNGTVQNYNLHQGFQGPFTIQGVIDSHNRMPRFGGVYGSALQGGTDYEVKGFLVLQHGDVTIQNIEFSNVRGNGWQGVGVPTSSGAGNAIRKNGQTYGNLIVDNCYIHDCDQGIETGDGTGAIAITNTEVVNCGGCYQGSGATHAIYIGMASSLTVDNLLSWRTMNGHCLKTRAQSTSVLNSRLYDGERGGGSMQIDFCEGGANLVQNCVIQKGPFAQNPASVVVGDDTQNVSFSSSALTLIGNTFISNTYSGLINDAIYMFGRVSAKTGAYSSVVAINNNFAGYGSGQYLGAWPVYNTDMEMSVTSVAYGDGRSPTTGLSITGSTAIAQPALDFSHPFAATGNALSRPGPFYLPYDGEGETNFSSPATGWPNTFGVQIDPGSDDIRVSAAASPVGTVLFTCSATGAPYFATNSPTDIRIDPFVSGTTYALVSGVKTYAGLSYPLAPSGRYAINSLTGAVSVGSALAAGEVDTICVSATAPNGTIAQNFVYIVVTA